MQQAEKRPALAEAGAEAPMDSGDRPGVPIGAIDQDDFALMAGPHRRALMLHCYRMVGCMEEAEDLVQETLARAWRARHTYQGRAPFRSWLYRIATNLSLDALRQRPRRSLPVARTPASSPDQPVPASINEPIWLEPCPDALLPADERDPETILATRERVSLAFMIALHTLPPRQRAVLILRDVLEMPASEVAELLEQSVPAVKSALHRARTAIAEVSHEAEPAVRSSANREHGERLARYVTAWESADVENLMRLLRDDARFSMPPIPSWYQGREEIGALVRNTIFRGDANGRWRLLPTNAGGTEAFGLYRLNERGGGHDFYGIQVPTFAEGLIADITTCRNPRLARFFDLPEHLPA
ncbi:MAG TPA: RNA polymerase subunit sigma-70 [Candidatus Kapabacteria bacterium]|nr:RNA polymerase subunit sigma-70 [Candidatus Kapabacteria bacterium]